MYGMGLKQNITQYQSIANLRIAIGISKSIRDTKKLTKSIIRINYCEVLQFYV